MKTTKKAKRIIAFAAALSMSACMMAMPAGTAFAAGNTITISDAGEYDHSQGYVAYQIFKGDYSSTDGLTVTGWGNGINVSAFVSALKTDYKKENGANPFDIEAIKTDNTNVSTPANAQAVADVVATLGDKSNDAEAFARLALKYSKYGDTGSDVEHKSGIGDNANKISDLSDGYYVVADKAAATKNGNSAFTLGMLVAGGDQTVTTKIGYPEVVKKVEENSEVPGYDGMGENDSNNYNDVADYNIGDSVRFKLYGSMPSNLGEYGAYYYKFTDTLAKGFTAPNSVKIKIGNTEIKEDKNTRVKINTNSSTKVTTIIVSFEDIKKCKDNSGNFVTVGTDSVVTVEYTADLNKEAVIGLSGNENSVHLSYLNNPNVEYTPNTEDTIEDRPNYPYDTDNDGTPDDNNNDGKPDYPTNNPNDGNPYDDKYVQPDADDKDDNSDDDKNDDNNNVSETPEDKVVVFTYELDVTKKDAATDAKLSGAKFKLAKNFTEGENQTTKFAKVNEETGAITWDTTEFTEFVSGTDGLISIKGLDDGIYTLVEISAPQNYNSPAANNGLKFEINADTDNIQTWDGVSADTVLKGLKVVKLTPDTGVTELLNNFPVQNNSENSVVANTHSGNLSNGTVAFEIKNTKGAQLPSTGGMGTTVFLLTGGTVAGAAAILYITKKRTSAEAK